MATIERYQTASGATLYRVRYRTPDHRQTDKRGFATKRDAERFAATVEVAKMRGEYVAPSLGRVTVGELGAAWLHRQRGHLKPSSYRVAEIEWRVRVAPRWGHVALGDIRPTAIQRWVSDLSHGVDGAKPVGASVVNRAHVLSSILADAVRDHLLAANPWGATTFGTATPCVGVSRAWSSSHRCMQSVGVSTKCGQNVGTGWAADPTIGRQ
jgi:hypothetical protein